MAFAAHVAGFVIGMIGVFVFRKRDVAEWDYGRRVPERTREQRSILIASRGTIR